MIRLLLKTTAGDTVKLTGEGVSVRSPDQDNIGYSR